MSTPVSITIHSTFLPHDALLGVQPDVLREAGQLEPGDADGDRDGGPAAQMETL